MPTIIFESDVEGIGGVANASELTFTPMSGINSTDTQSAVVEVKTKTQPLSPILTALADLNDSNPFTDAEKAKLAELALSTIDGGNSTTQVIDTSIDGGAAGTF